jgi:predicted nucleic acid-binding protein
MCNIIHCYFVAHNWRQVDIGCVGLTPLWPLCFYDVERKVAAGKLSLPLQQHGVKLRDASSVLTALGWLQTSSVGFSDAYLAATASEEQLTVASFDADFDKLRVARYEPTA